MEVSACPAPEWGRDGGCQASKEAPRFYPPRILVLEGHKALFTRLQLTLRQAGYVVSLAFTLEAAWDALAQEIFALIVADLHLEFYHAGSFTPAHQLRHHVRPTPVGLLVTQAVPKEEMLRAGFAFVLPMPFNLDDLLGLVAATLETPISPAHHLYAPWSNAS